MAKISHDVSTTAGAIAADALQRKWYQAMQDKSAADRYKYLSNSGWKQLSKEKIKEVDPVSGKETGKEFVRVSWQAPAEYGEKRPFNQTRALLYEIWLDLERNGYVYRSDNPAYLSKQVQDNVVTLVTA
jgi:hypothetical protein